MNVLDFRFSNDPVNAPNPPTNPPTTAVTRNNHSFFGSVKIAAMRCVKSVVDDDSVIHALTNHKIAIAKNPARKLNFDFNKYPITKAATAM